MTNWALKTKMKIKQAGKAIEITDKAALVGHGNVYGEATNQIALAIAYKVDNDIVEVAKTATQNITEAPVSVANMTKPWRSSLMKKTHAM